MSDGVEVLDDGPRVIQALSAESEAVIGRLRGLEEGGVAAYGELSSLVGYDIQSRRGPIQTAVRRLLADEQMHFGTVRGVGIKRLSDAEAGRSLGSDTRRIRKAAHRGLKKVRAINLGNIPDQSARAAVIAKGSYFAMTERVASAGSQKKILAAVESEGANSALALQKCLAALKE